MARTGAEAQRERREAGKCCSCDEPIYRGSRCEKHWWIEKKRAARHYQSRKKRGLCGMCGSRPPEPGKEGCRQCLDRQNGRRQVPEEEKRVPFDKPLHQRNKEAGYCTLGGDKHERPEAGHSLCNMCRDKKRRRRRRRVRAGLCVNHPTVPAVTGRTICAVCVKRKQDQRQANIAAGLCAECGERPPIPGGKLCQKDLEEGRIKDKRKRAKLKLLVLSRYGDRCFCCHEGDPKLLQLDHINNDGNVHRRSIGGKNSIGSLKLYMWLKKHNFPGGIQLACGTCNQGRHHNGGICPHQQLPPALLRELQAVNEKIGRLVHAKIAAETD